LILDPLPGREAIRERPTDLLAIKAIDSFHGSCPACLLF
jgi:hypothetical protein